MSFITIPYRELEKYRSRTGSILIDVRSREEFQKNHIRGAKNIPCEQLEKYLKQLRKYSLIIFVCERGARSMQAARSCDAIGMKCVSVAGGMNAIVNTELD